CSKIFGRKYEVVNNVSAAGVILLVWSPFLFWDIGWRLSLLSALVISAMYQNRSSWLVISPAISLVTFPQVAYAFGSVPFVGFVVNLFAPFYFSFTLMIASFGAVLRLVNFPFSQYFMLAVEGLFMLWEKIADFFASLMPLTVGWNFLTAWIGCGTLTFFICRYLDLAPLRIAAVMGVIGFSAFALFL
ncbi:MAG: ComEC/Rec2 family competence protein, partial [Synergistaceae bacterium]|nr:ComEC/Rec2 family competence protein [Synergistaceae bacterium]